MLKLPEWSITAVELQNQGTLYKLKNNFGTTVEVLDKTNFGVLDNDEHPVIKSSNPPKDIFSRGEGNVKDESGKTILANPHVLKGIATTIKQFNLSKRASDTAKQASRFQNKCSLNNQTIECYGQKSSVLLFDADSNGTIDGFKTKFQGAEVMVTLKSDNPAQKKGIFDKFKATTFYLKADFKNP